MDTNKTREIKGKPLKTWLSRLKRNPKSQSSRLSKTQLNPVKLNREK